MKILLKTGTENHIISAHQTCFNDSE